MTADVRRHRDVLLIGAGVGITPLRGIAEDVLGEPPSPGVGGLRRPSVVLLHRIRDYSGLLFDAEIGALAAHANLQCRCLHRASRPRHGFLARPCRPRPRGRARKSCTRHSCQGHLSVRPRRMDGRSPPHPDHLGRAPDRHPRRGVLMVTPKSPRQFRGMRRLTLTGAGTATALVLLFSYRTSTGHSGADTAQSIGPAQVISGSAAEDQAPATTPYAGGATDGHAAVSTPSAMPTTATTSSGATSAGSNTATRRSTSSNTGSPTATTRVRRPRVPRPHPTPPRSPSTARRR